jgi:hypothetical protein
MGVGAAQMTYTRDPKLLEQLVGEAVATPETIARAEDVNMRVSKLEKDVLANADSVWSGASQRIQEFDQLDADLAGARLAYDQEEASIPAAKYTSRSGELIHAAIIVAIVGFVLLVGGSVLLSFPELTGSRSPYKLDGSR